MRLLFCGDIVGRTGRDVVVARLPALKRDHKIDFVVANGENAAGGFGITRKICDDLYAAGVDCITTGNHVWDQKETVGFIGNDPRLLRPNNFPAGTPGKGAAYQTDAGMCGDYDSVIGMEKSMPIARFTRKMPTERLSAANGPGTLCAVLVETDDATGLAKALQPVRLGGKLSQNGISA